MPTMSWISGAPTLAVACVLACANVHAQTNAPLLNEVHTVGAATTGVPVEETFNISTAGTYQITLTDLGAQLSAPLAAVELAITSGSSLVSLTAATGSTLDSTKTQLVGAGGATFSAQPGSYIVHVVGAPTTTPGSGPVGIAITNTAGGAQVAAFSDNLVLPPSSSSSNNAVGSVNDTFTVSAAGTYQVTLTDMQVPSGLATVVLAITTEGSATLLANLTAGGSNPATATSTVTLQPGVTYGIFAGGQAGAAAAGLYGVNVSPTGGGVPVYSKTVPVGSAVSIGSPALTASNYTVSPADLTFPSALAQLGVAVTLNGQLVSALSATGTSSPFAASATQYQVFATGVPASNSQGSYTVTLQPVGGSPVLNVARAVSDPASGVSAYSFDTNTVGSETYSLDLADFGYPNAFASLQATAVQNGAQVGTPLLMATGSNTAQENITPAAGPVTLVVFAKPTPATGSSTSTAGLFGIDLTVNGAGAPAFETSQGVGQPFTVKKVTISTGGNYQVVVTDVGFPAKFSNLAVIVTRGTSKIGSIYGGSTLSFSATGGDYLVNLVAQPATTNPATAAGTYSMVVQAAPPAATVTLQTSATSVSSGGTANLTWTSTNTSSCTASSSPAGAWTGTVATSGSTATPALTTTTTFTLICAGTDGTNPTATVTVNVGSSSGGGGHGGGAIRPDVLVVLLTLLGLRVMGGRIPGAAHMPRALWWRKRK
jgi:hypothetical protein